MSSDGPIPPHSASVSTFSKSHSYHSSRAPPTIRTVVTSPPWARDEPPSPKDREPTDTGVRNLAEPRHSETTSYESSSVPEEPGPSRWWAFTRHRPSDSISSPLATNAARPARRRSRERSMSIPWLSASHLRRAQEGASPIREDQVEDGEARVSTRRHLHLDLPPPTAPITLSQNITPGWETPWTSRPPGEPRGLNVRDRNNENGNAQARTDDDEKQSPWARRKKRFRAYMLYNTYVPLLFRFVNIVLTTAALAMAIRIRILEERHHVRGAVGSSPTLVIIFGSLTLVHVMIAIYVRKTFRTQNLQLEYFGRPLGLWHTSWKLAYTLSEVVFICAWSAALALAFDNFFTSPIPCASASSISWYSEIPRPSLPHGVNALEGGVGDTICDDQLALICLVGVGLMMYCFNLIIALFRIFEKVKYHPTSVLSA
ncbi:Regulator of phospholipase D SRF1 [Grifola frondosa]|uniref:Regulator of phospholipase D SRF1 n=1 Tax=Grifola frondosa TaxID=5627 RepID=A0A1C7MRQ5_GRIFR|nr:Regulator of phospholipase D SRF1 [Grifola frondosa]